MEGRKGESLITPLLAKCPHGLPSIEGVVDGDEIPHVLLILRLYLVILKGLLPFMKASHSVIMQNAMGVGRGARRYGWVSKSLWLYSFPLLILESPPCATPIQGEIIPGCNGGPKGKRLCYSAQPLHGPLEHPLCLLAAWVSIVIRWSMWSPPPGLG